MLCFFFSSRRRHTRCGRDWSSDVCSSDLLFTQEAQLAPLMASTCASSPLEEPAAAGVCAAAGDVWFTVSMTRSEERRVGKECRSRWSADHEKKNDTRTTLQTIANSRTASR